MTDGTPIIASAVLVPEEEELSSTSLKRRRSSLSDSEAKRQRLDHNDGSVKADETAPSGSTKEDPDTKSRGVHQAEERKRGRRLFGALLGTLSQSSSSTAQKRRTEIERKQQAKLRQQAEEQDEAKREKLQALTAARTKEQKLFSKQSMKIRHSNLLAEAQFLHTTSQPKIFYKPWKLRSANEEKIAKQVKETKAMIQEELARWEDYPLEKDESSNNPRDKVGQVKVEVNGRMDAVGEKSVAKEPSGPDKANRSDHGRNESTDEERVKSEPQETGKDHGDGEEVVEGEEDTVIY